MNRFQFRVFSTVTKRYTDIGLSTALAANSVSNNQFVIQQCLEVQDKNNRLIYEGDVVKFTANEYEMDGLKVTSISPSIGEIIYVVNNCAFRVKTIKIGKYREQDRYISELNIFDYDEEIPLYFYDEYEGYEEFKWKELEVVGSIVDTYFISLDNQVSKLTTPDDLVKLLTEDKTT